MTKKQSKTTEKEVKYIPDTAHIIKLNQELTEENSRLLQRVDRLKGRIENYIDLVGDTETELNTIKSKWWYKLFRNW